MTPSDEPVTRRPVPDGVDAVLEQWRSERPDLDTTAMGTIGRLSRASHLVQQRLKANFARFDLEPAAFDVLATLRRAGPPYRLSPSALVTTAMVTSGAITQRLDRLESRGLVRREPDASDGRGVVVELTVAGSALVDQVLPAHLAVLEVVLGGISPDERAGLDRGLRALLGALAP
jgi:DNA-binding MarR family transcriptional regulator